MFNKIYWFLKFCDFKDGSHEAYTVYNNQGVGFIYLIKLII